MIDVLFWSGGKDSYLAYLFHPKETKNEIILLTTYDEETQTVPFQNISLDDIVSQADFLNKKLISVPLPPNCPNTIYLEKVTAALSEITNLEYLVFGDLWIEDIRSWREKTFAEYGFQCRFPVWEKPYHQLYPELWKTPVTIKISSVNQDYEEYISEGVTFNHNFIDHLPDFIDPMGEKGEFHTQVIFH
ncbi:MAG TPA: hypothetical protein VKA34_12410 [Balneolales bacterium]|nr:hypothetical protein [Balneolales bacterium]